MKQISPSKKILFRFFFFLTGALLISAFPAKSFTVKNLKANYSNGQVFLVWHNPSAVNLQYNVYRSQTKFTNLSQLHGATYLGFVRDSSAKNYRLSLLDNANVFYKYQNNGKHLSPGRGLYAVTCTDNASYYYAVMVVDLSTGVESKIINDGKNSLSSAVNEIVAKAQPVFQDSVLTQSGQMKYRYVQFVNNQETSLYPAMNSTGSYGFNFCYVKGTGAGIHPMIVLYQGEDLAADANLNVESQFDNCYVLGVDDWLPVKFSDGTFGHDTYWSCYHEHFNIYTDQNPVPTSGVVKSYTQSRVIEAIRWMRQHLPIDSGSIYTRGTSHNGFGALLTATIYPEEIAAVYGIVEPTEIGSNGVSIFEQMWGLDQQSLNSDVMDFNTGDTLTFNKLTNLKKMLAVNENRSVPLIFDIHGKNDHTNSWTSGKVAWLDSLNNNYYGGARYWDQRQHNGDGKDFTNDETLPDFLRYHTTKSYPVFSNCSVNQNPGNGQKTNGDPYGAFNGYLDFDDDITDENCEYDVKVFVKDLYVGGVLAPNQYSTCTADLAFRRLQHFIPASGLKVKWKNHDSTNAVIQSGSFNASDKLMVIKNIIINKSGNRIQLTITNCQKNDEEMNTANENPDFIKTPSGYTAVIFSEQDENATLNVFDVMGRMVFAKNISLVSGSNTIEIPSPGNGIYLIQVKSEDLSVARKLMF